MGSTRAHIVLPDDLIADIDSLVGARGRSAFLAETARAEVRRRRLLEFLADPEPAWRDEDHPELAKGAAHWVKEMRRRSDERLKPAWRRSKKK
ncbi:MAG TPA: hypothetical protein VN612_17685 [Acidobacteriaceae bacterium]|nr:hypothetical protein [Acidobacteriaceae bacterium]